MHLIKNLSHILFCLSFLCLVSCEEDFQLDTSNFSSTVVLDGLFVEGQLWTVRLTSTRNIYDANSKSVPITDATILITELSGTGDCRLYHVGEGIYQSEDCMPEAETTYRIFAEAPGYDIVTAISEVPKKAKVTVQPIKKNEDLGSLEFTIQEQSELDDFYIWDLIRDTIRIGGEGSNGSNSGGAFNPKELVDDLSDDFTKLKFNNTASSLSAESSGSIGAIIGKNITGRLEMFGLDKNGPPNVGTDQIVTKLRVMTVSRDLYQYYKSIEQYLQFQDYQTSITESRSIHSNIKGGVGIFAGYSFETFDITE